SADSEASLSPAALPSAASITSNCHSERSEESASAVDLPRETRNEKPETVLRETCNVQRETGTTETVQRATGSLHPDARARLTRAVVRLAGKPNSKTFAQHIKLAAALHQGKLDAAEFM